VSPAPREQGVPRRVRIPADMDRPDRILAGLTARQLAILAAVGVILWASYAGLSRFVPLPVFGALGAPVAVAALSLALGRRDGLSLDRFALAALRQSARPRRLVPAPGGVVPAPGWAGVDPAPAPEPLELPCRDVTDSGVVDLGGDGAALICQASAVAFGLRTPAEQQGLVDGFGRYLNGLSEPVELAPAIAALQEAAGGLPHPALEAAALAHAGFLARLATERQLLDRRVLVVLRDPIGGADATARLRRRAEEASTALAGAGVTISVLEDRAAEECLRSAVDPWAVDPWAVDPWAGARRMTSAAEPILAGSVR